VTMYDQPQEHKFMRVTCGGPVQAGRMLRGMSEDIRLRRCDQVVAVADGAQWIAGLIDRNLPKQKTTVVLDFYHAAEHVHQTRRVMFGPTNPEGEQWAGELIHLLLEEPFEKAWEPQRCVAVQPIAGLLEEPFEKAWERLVKDHARVRSQVRRQSLDELMQYLWNRKEKVDYARFKAMGLKIGSGPTEPGCKSESRRLKGVGMRWNAANAQAMTALEALHQSNLWPACWKSRIKVAA